MATLKVKPGRIGGELAVPGSKSHAVRAAAVAAMARGTSTVRAPLDSADTRSALNAARAFGAQIQELDDRWVITGADDVRAALAAMINVGNSGTTLSIFSGLAATLGATVNFDGDDSIRRRPMAPVLDALGQLGARSVSVNGCCPLTIHGPIRGGVAEISGRSSQFVTAILFAAPLAEGDTELRVTGLNERPYVEITLDWLRRQGIRLEHAPDLSWFRIPGRQAYRPFDLTLPADFSTAAFPLLAAAVTGGEVRLRNLDFADHQGDKAVFGFFEQMGVTVERGPEFTTVRADGPLRAVTLDLNATPDALPALAVAASFAHGKSFLGNVEQARIKECDRIAAMAGELRKLGIEVEEFEDGLAITGGRPRGARVDGHDDHRIVMALAIAGLAAEGETSVATAEAAAVTYPGFVADFQRLGADFCLMRPVATVKAPNA
jgi:3-phosphoshikimate 1-carboxyvinyltransferase